MMLHRHFEGQGTDQNITKLADVTPGKKKEEFVSEVFPPETPEEAPKRRTRAKKAE